MSTDLTHPSPERRGARHEPTRRPRLRGEDRDRVRAALAKEYDAGTSIRALADERGLSFGLTRTLLLEAKVKLRHQPRRLTGAGR
ncbi:helix-turn-helix domain-containing protein [Streptomyces sp. NPDC092952]|uniref:helix-turn-helix domain-containing protein n=1 Tax=Streptomyces sp. NPDC092952 TaxID=3366018 RepID=UPI0038073314